MLIRYLWQLKKAVFRHRCQICTVPLRFFSERVNNRSRLRRPGRRPRRNQRRRQRKTSRRQIGGVDVGIFTAQRRRSSLRRPVREVSLPLQDSVIFAVDRLVRHFAFIRA